MTRVIFDPKTDGETVTLTFPFLSRMAAAETISTQSVVASVYSGTDGSPSNIVSGSASASGSNVTQKIAGGVVGVIYQLLCTITTSAGQTLELAGFLAVVPDVT